MRPPQSSRVGDSSGVRRFPFVGRSETGRRLGPGHGTLDDHALTAQRVPGRALDEDAHARCVRKLRCRIDDLPEAPEHARAAAAGVDLPGEIGPHHPVLDAHSPQPCSRWDGRAEPLPTLGVGGSFQQRQKRLPHPGGGVSPLGRAARRDGEHREEEDRYAPPHHPALPLPLRSFTNSASVIVFTFSFFAFSSFDPGSPPTTTRAVFFGTPPPTVPPWSRTACSACVRGKRASVPVMTTCLPARAPL